MRLKTTKNPMLFALLVLTSTTATATPPPIKAEESAAATQYQQLNVAKNPMNAAAGIYKLDPHHTSVTVKLAHMDLSSYTLRFDDISGRFDFHPATSSATDLEISINPQSIDTGDKVFDKKIALKYFEAEKYTDIRFTAASITITDGHAAVAGTLDFHGVKKTVVLNAIYHGFAESRMGFSGEATFKRSDFGVGEWVPLEADDVTVLVETEFLKQ